MATAKLVILIVGFTAMLAFIAIVVIHALKEQKKLSQNTQKPNQTEVNVKNFVKGETINNTRINNRRGIGIY